MRIVTKLNDTMLKRYRKETQDAKKRNETIRWREKNCGKMSEAKVKMQEEKLSE
jgi:hypothetical protein